MRKLALFFAIPAILIGCSEDDKPKKPKDNVQIETGLFGGTEVAADTILVTDEAGRGLANARVLVGESLNVPFAGNFLTTNESGEVVLPAAWRTPLPVTVEAAGYVRVTHFGRLPGGMTFKLRKTPRVPHLRLGGVTTGHPVKDGDGFADFGLVMSALTRNDVLAFDISKVISPQMDTITVMGQKIDIPSNITLPRQRESYILPLTLDKPAYRLFFADRQRYKVFAAQGRFPFKKTIDAVRAKKQFYELINDFDITGGVVRDVQIQRSARLDLPTTEMSFKSKKPFRAPPLRSDEVLIALAAADLKGAMIPTDIKRVESNQTINMGTYSGAPSLAVAVLKNSDEFSLAAAGGRDRLSAVMLPFSSSGVKPNFLSLIPDPRLTRDGLTLTKPARLSGVNELATLAILSDVQEMTADGTEGALPFLVHQWEVYAPEWVDRIDLPQWPGAAVQAKRMKWEVAFLGSQTKTSAELGQPVIDAATHVTHSSVDF